MTDTNHSESTTRWTRVSLARSDSDDGRKALAELCEAYYEPVVTFLRCELRDADLARELGHAFFARMLEGGSIEGGDPDRGRFRSYLLGAVKHFLSHQREAAHRQKRGGGKALVRLEDERAKTVQDAGRLSPDAEFDRQWAITVLGRGLEALRRECEQNGRIDFFNRVKPLLTGDGEHGDQGQLAASCNMKLDAFRMAVHRLKKRLRQHVEAEIAGTLQDAAMVEEEMKSLFAALHG